MSIFNINCNECSQAMNGFRTLAGTMNSYSDQIREIRNKLSISGSAAISLERSLSFNVEQIETVSATLEKLSNTGNDIVYLYADCDQRVEDISSQDSIASAGASDAASPEVMGATKSAADDVFGEDNKFKYENDQGRKLVYHEGEPKQPEWEPYKQYDNDYPYDPDAKAEFSDYANWVKWGAMLNGGTAIKNDELEDALKCYAHYRYGDGDDLEIDYAKAYREDSAIRSAVDGYVYDTQLAVEDMIRQGKQPPFQITSELMPVGYPNYPVTENWQKAIGAHHIWISADVSMNADGEIVMKTTIHEIDRYNFNAGSADITTGAKDDENGRFERLGWAHSFTTKGSMDMDVQWKPSEATKKPSVPSEGRGSGRNNVIDNMR